MLTTTGWGVAIGSLSLVVVGRLLGIPELFYVGAGGVALVVACALRVSLVRLKVDVVRELQPSRVHAGTPSRVELRVRNRSGTRTPVMTLRDPVGKGRTARVVLAPLGGSDTVRAAYRLPTERRGLLKVGPMSIEVTDPFGLASTTAQGAGVGELTVWPAVDDVEPLPHTIGDDPLAGADASNVSSQGDEFYALRPYVLGDDLRRVHWRSSARSDDLMVRQDEMPWQGRATVLLDSRRGAHSQESFERAVSAAASVILACSRKRFLVRLVTTVGDDSQFGQGGTHVEQILERLATIELTDEGRLDHVLTSLRRPGSGGALVAMLGGRAHPDVSSVQRLRQSHPSITVVRFVVARLDREQQAPGEILVDDEHPFAESWDAARRAARARRVATVRR
ncbi:MAG TPA: DUF58 domain-containing protein [Acidimicrobiales bacterium]|nr:DUF58 domain-containing protein [Acidimicrobiales bacterium]